MTRCFYRRLTGASEYQSFESTDYTRSEAGRLADGSSLRVGRLSLDLLGAVPVALVRRGRRWSIRVRGTASRAATSPAAQWESAR